MAVSVGCRFQLVRVLWFCHAEFVVMALQCFQWPTQLMTSGQHQAPCWVRADSKICVSACFFRLFSNHGFRWLPKAGQKLGWQTPTALCSCSNFPKTVITGKSFFSPQLWRVRNDFTKLSTVGAAAWPPLSVFSESFAHTELPKPSPYCLSHFTSLLAPFVWKELLALSYKIQENRVGQDTRMQIPGDVECSTKSVVLQ